MWWKVDNSSISIRETIITSTLWGFDQSIFFEEGSWLKFNNLRLVLGMVFKFKSSVGKKLKLKFKKFWGLIPPFSEAVEGICQILWTE